MFHSQKVLLCAAACLPLLAHQPHDPITTVAVSPNFAQDHTVLAATDALSIKIDVYLLIKSTDGGASWSPVSGLGNNNKVQAIVFSPAYAQDQTIYVAGAAGIFRTANQGNSWSQLAKQSVMSLALSPNFAVDNTLFGVTAKATILTSTDRGQTLTLLPSPAPLTSGLNVISVSPNYSVDHTLLLGSNADGIFESTNGGANWVQVTAGANQPPVTALAYSPNYSTDLTVFAGTLGSGILISTNAARNWAQSNTGITDLNVTSIAFSATYSQDTTLWITTSSGGVCVSVTRGSDWTVGAAVPRILSPQVPVHYQSIAAAPGSPTTVLFLGMYEGLWSSSTGAASWQYADILPTRLIRYVHLSPTYPRDRTIFANTYGGGNLWSAVGGTVWTFQNTGMQSTYTDASGISPNYAKDGIAFSSMGYYLQRTSDRGATWQTMQALGQVTYARSLAISPNFAKDSTVLIGTDNQPGSIYPPYVTYQGKRYPNQGLFLSVDGGNNWIPTTLGGPPVISIAISPAFATDKTAFAACPGRGPYKSVDGGMTWNLDALPGNSTLVTKVAVSPAYTTDHTVFAVLISGGLYKSSDSGSTWSLVPETGSIRVMDIEFSPNYAADRTLFAGTVQQALMRSTNGGTTLHAITTFPDNFVTAISLSPNFAKDRTIFAAGYHGLYKSVNAGNTWTYTVEPARIEDSRNQNSTIDQQPPTVTYNGSWTQVTPAAAASSNSYEVTSESQDTATLQFLGSGIRWLSWIGPDQGLASLALDGVTQGQVSLTAPADQFQQNVWEQHGFICAPHTFTVTALPLTGQTVSVDAFDIWVDTCPFLATQELH